MNMYVCSIDLRNDAKALVFAKALSDWMDHLKDRGVILGWTLMRRKLGLSSDRHRDFLLQIEVEDMAQLDQAFRTLASHDDTIDSLYRALHDHILAADAGLFRPFPDSERAERVAFL